MKIKDVIILVLGFTVMYFLVWDKEDVVPPDPMLKVYRDSITTLQKSRESFEKKIDSLEKDKKEVAGRIAKMSASEVQFKLNIGRKESDRLIPVPEPKARESLECLELLPIVQKELKYQKNINEMLHSEIAVNEEAFQLQYMGLENKNNSLEKKVNKQKWAIRILAAIAIYQLIQN